MGLSEVSARSRRIYPRVWFQKFEQVTEQCRGLVGGVDPVLMEAIEKKLLGIMTGNFFGQIRRRLRFSDQSDFPPVTCFYLYCLFLGWK
jgi:hypothetical protein